MHAGRIRQRVGERLIHIVGDEHPGRVDIHACGCERRLAATPRRNRLAGAEMPPAATQSV